MVALGIVVGAVLYATACLLAFRPAGADETYRPRSTVSCECRGAK